MGRGYSEEVIESENMRDWEGQVRGEMEWENNERAILVEEAIMGLVRDLELKKFAGIHRRTAGKTSSNSG